MALFVVVQERGGSWDWARPLREQVDWEAHAAFMESLVDVGFILVGGPLGGEDDARRVLHIVEAENAQAVEERLNADPWASRLLRTVSIEPWTILLGGLGRNAATEHQ